MASSSVTLHPPPRSGSAPNLGPSPLPSLLQTPSGLALLELQGSIHFADASAAEPGGAPLPIGRLAFPDYQPDGLDPESTRWMKRVYLYVGQHQRLAGEAKKLPKPIAVVRRRGVGVDAGARTDHLRGDGDDQDAPAEELEVVDIVRYKLVFSQRPEPVGTNAAA